MHMFIVTCQWCPFVEVFWCCAFFCCVCCFQAYPSVIGGVGAGGQHMAVMVFINCIVSALAGFHSF